MSLQQPTSTSKSTPKDVLHNPRESVVVRIGIGRKAAFLANSRAIGKRSNAAYCPRQRYHRPQGVMQDIAKVLALCANSGLAIPKKQVTEIYRF